MKKILLISSLLLIIKNGYAQYDFLFTKKSLAEVASYEDSLKSQLTGFVKTNVAKDYFPTAKDNYAYYPLSYTRTNDKFFPTLHTAYFYSEPDSTLLSTSYDWNIMDYVSNLKTDGYKLEIEKKRKKEYLEKYNSIKKYLVSRLGKPAKAEENKSNTGYFYRLTWKQEQFDVLVLLKFSTELLDLPGDMKVGSYNIRVQINYTN